MSFNLRVVFTGICAFIPNALPERESRTRMCVVLPNGHSTKKTVRKGEDGSPLRRHQGFIQLKARHVVATVDQQMARLIPSEADVIWNLDHHRVTFEYEQNNDEPEPPILSGQVPNSLAKMDEMLPDFATVDLDVVTDDPNRKTIAQVLLERGALRVASPKSKLRQWVFPNVLTTDVLKQTLSNEIHLEINYLDKVTVVATPYDTTQQQVVRWPLESLDGEDVVITIANLCDDNPLRWETEGEAPGPEEDFRWYYTLLTNNAQTELSLRLNGLPFPIPMCPVNEEINGMGLNCVPLGANPAPIPTTSG